LRSEQTDDATSIVIPSSGESHRPPRKGYPLAAKVYQQDELSPSNKDALFAGNKVELSPVNSSRESLLRRERHSME
jgi:hypothetical protein